jgi:hypothetical protein
MFQDDFLCGYIYVSETFVPVTNARENKLKGAKICFGLWNQELQSKVAGCIM